MANFRELRYGEVQRIAPPRCPNPLRRGLDCYRELRRILLPRTPVNKPFYAFCTHSFTASSDKIIRLGDVLVVHGCYFLHKRYARAPAGKEVPRWATKGRTEG